jgi:hypothetical protein
VLLQVLSAPNLIRLDVKLMRDQDCAALLKCGELLHPVIELRVYGMCRTGLDLKSLSTIMPDVKTLDVTTVRGPSVGSMCCDGRIQME